jgi:hypothetical protein
MLDWIENSGVLEWAESVTGGLARGLALGDPNRAGLATFSKRSNGKKSGEVGKEFIQHCYSQTTGGPVPKACLWRLTVLPLGGLRRPWLRRSQVLRSQRHRLQSSSKALLRGKL